MGWYLNLSLDCFLSYVVVTAKTCLGYCIVYTNSPNPDAWTCLFDLMSFQISKLQPQRLWFSSPCGSDGSAHFWTTRLHSLSVLLGTGRWVKVKICRYKLSHGISVIQSLECSWLTCRLNMEATERMPSIFSRVLWSGCVAAPLREHRRNASLLKLSQQNHPRQLPYHGFSLSGSNFSVAH